MGHARSQAFQGGGGNEDGLPTKGRREGIQVEAIGRRIACSSQRGEEGSRQAEGRPGIKEEEDREGQAVDPGRQIKRRLT